MNRLRTKALGVASSLLVAAGALTAPATTAVASAAPHAPGVVYEYEHTSSFYIPTYYDSDGVKRPNMDRVRYTFTPDSGAGIHDAELLSSCTKFSPSGGTPHWPSEFTQVGNSCTIKVSGENYPNPGHYEFYLRTAKGVEHKIVIDTIDVRKSLMDGKDFILLPRSGAKGFMTFGWRPIPDYQSCRDYRGPWWSHQFGPNMGSDDLDCAIFFDQGSIPAKDFDPNLNYAADFALTQSPSGKRDRVMHLGFTGGNTYASRLPQGGGYAKVHPGDDKAVKTVGRWDHKANSSSSRGYHQTCVMSPDQDINVEKYLRPASKVFDCQSLRVRVLPEARAGQYYLRYRSLFSDGSSTTRVLMLQVLPTSSKYTGLKAHPYNGRVVVRGRTTTMPPFSPLPSGSRVSLRSGPSWATTSGTNFILKPGYNETAQTATLKYRVTFPDTSTLDSDVSITLTSESDKHSPKAPSSVTIDRSRQSFDLTGVPRGAKVTKVSGPSWVSVSGSTVTFRADSRSRSGDVRLRVTYADGSHDDVSFDVTVLQPLKDAPTTRPTSKPVTTTTKQVTVVTTTTKSAEPTTTTRRPISTEPTVVTTTTKAPAPGGSGNSPVVVTPDEPGHTGDIDFGGAVDTSGDVTKVVPGTVITSTVAGIADGSTCEEVHTALVDVDAACRVTIHPTIDTAPGTYPTQVTVTDSDGFPSVATIPVGVVARDDQTGVTPPARNGSSDGGDSGSSPLLAIIGVLGVLAAVIGGAVATHPGLLPFPRP